MAFNKNKVMDTARRYLERGQLDKAVKEYLRVVTEDPSDVRVWLKIGDLYVKKGDKREATETYLRVAEFYSGQGFYLKAVAVYKQIIKLNPRLVEVNLKLAELYRQLGLMSDAMQHFEMVAGHFHREGKTKEALATVRQLVDLDPDNVATRIKLAELYSKEGLAEEAVAEFARACDYLRANKREEDFIKVGERLLWHKADNVELSRELAALYLRRNDPRRALQKLQVCFKANSRDVETLALLAQAFQALDQKAKTVSVLKEQARVFDEDGKRERAEEIHRRILALQPGDRDSLAYLGQAAPAGGPPPPPEPAARQPRQRQLTMSAFNAVQEPRTAQPTGSVPLIDERSIPAYLREPSGSQVQARPGERRQGGSVAAYVAEAPSFESSVSSEVHSEEIAQILTETDVYVKYGLHEKAVEHLRRIFALDPTNVEARERLKEILLTQGRGDEAISELMRLAELTAGQDPQRTGSYLREILNINGAYRPAIDLARRLGLRIATAQVPPVRAAAPGRKGPAPGEETLDLVEIEIEEDRPADPDSTHVRGHQQRKQPQAGPGVRAAPSQAVRSGAAPSPANDLEFVLEDLDEPDEIVDTTIIAVELDADDVEPIDDDVEDSDVLSSSRSRQEAEQQGNTTDTFFSTEIGSLPGDQAPVTLSGANPLGQEVFEGATQVFEFDPEDASVFGAEPISDIMEPFVAPEEQEASPRRTRARGSDMGLQDGDDSFGNDTVDIRIGSDNGGRPKRSSTRPGARIDDDLDEADFFMTQGLYTEARDVLRNLLSRHPNHPLLLAKLQEIDELESSGMLPASAPPAQDYPGGSRTGASLSTRQYGRSKSQDPSRPTVMLEKPIEESDADTHYDLGLAYKEMGLYDEAIRAFEKVSRVPGREVQCLLMIGLCYREQGDSLEAINQFKAGLHAPGIVEQEQLGLYYEIAVTYETEVGDAQEALYFYELIRKRDSTYRDVTSRIAGIKAGQGRREAETRKQISAEAEAAIDSLLDEDKPGRRRR